MRQSQAFIDNPKNFCLDTWKLLLNGFGRIFSSFFFIINFETIKNKFSVTQSCTPTFYLFNFSHLSFRFQGRRQLFLI